MTLPRKDIPHREPGTLRDLRPPSFADLLRRYRTTAGLTQEDLAERATLSARAISDLERGLKTRPQRETVRLLSEALLLEAEERTRLEQAARHKPTRPTPPPLAPVPGNLPAPPTPLIGREATVAAAVARMRAPDTRLLAITGPGGIGKSRLGLAVAELLRPNYPDGVFFVPLAALNDPALVEAAIARPLGIAERGGQPLRETLLDALRAKRLLLLLDNFEHLGPAVALVDALLAGCRGIAILVTSRSPLASPWYREFPLPPLALPPDEGAGDPVTLARVPAVALFVARAGAVRPDFRLTATNAPAVAGICRRLDGLPLALELAAARLRLLSPAALLERLDEPFRLLSSSGTDLPARQRTMRAAIEWSHDLLEPAERTLFRRLAIFSGGWDLEAAEAICATPLAPDDEPIDVLDLADRLVAQSLVRSSAPTDDEPRLTMFETIRSFASEQLAAHGEREQLQAAHATYYLALAERGEVELGGPEGVAWLDRLDREHDNFRAALGWAQATGAQAIGLRLAAALGRFWYTRGHLREGQSWLERWLAPGAEGDAHMRGKAATMVGLIFFAQSALTAAITWLNQGVALSRQSENFPFLTVALNGLGLIYSDRAEYDRAEALYAECLDVQCASGDRAGIARTRNNQAAIARHRGDHQRAIACYAEAIAIWRELGITLNLSIALGNLGQLLHERGETQRAEEALADCLDLAAERGNPQTAAYARNTLGTIARQRGDHTQARQLHEQSLATFRNLGNQTEIANTLLNLARVALDTADEAQARQIGEESLAISRQVGHQRNIANGSLLLGDVDRRQGEVRAARARYHESLRFFDGAGDLHGMAQTLERLGILAATAGRDETALRLLGASAALRDNLGTPLPPNERAEQQQCLAALRTILGESAYLATLAAGRALASDTAVAEGMADEATGP